jgi:hypothetical protein
MASLLSSYGPDLDLPAVLVSAALVIALLLAGAEL